MAIQALITDETGKAIKDALASIQAAIQQQGQGGQGGGVSISVETDPEALTTLSQSVVYFLAPGTWTAFSPAVTVAAGKFGIAKYGTAWTVTVLGGGELASAIAAMTAADELTGDEVLPMGSGESVTVKQLAEFAEGVVGGNTAHVSGETADQAKLASVGKVMELIGSGRRVEPITSEPETPNTGVIYFVDNREGAESISIGTASVPTGTTAHVYHDGSEWVAVKDMGTMIETTLSRVTTVSDSKTQYKATTKKAIGSNTGIIDVSDQPSAFVTSEITLKKGDELIVTNEYKASSNTAMGACIYIKLDGGKYYPTNGLRAQSKYSWIADRDCTVVCQYFGANSTIKKRIHTGSLKTQILDKIDSDLGDKKARIDLYYGKDWTRVLSDRNSDILKAMLEREAMINEVRLIEKENTTDGNGVTSNPHVMCEGSCGFTRNTDGTFNDGTIKFKIYDTGLLHIKGHGEMYDYVKGTNYDHDYDTIVRDANNRWNNGNPRDVDTFFMASYYGFFTNDNDNNGQPYTSYQESIPTSGEAEGIHYQQPAFGGANISYDDRPKHYVPRTVGDSSLHEKYLQGTALSGHIGYCAPWYRYRSEFQFGEGYLGDITTDSYEANYTRNSYAISNPLGIRYDRILIEDDNATGITYLGSWAFYRCSAKSIVIPNHVERIGSWCFRYSPNLDTIVFPDSVHIYEDVCISRNEVLRTIRLGNFQPGEGVTDYIYEMRAGAISMCSNLTELILPKSNTTISVSSAGTFASSKIRYIEYNNASRIATPGGLSNPNKLEYARISGNTIIPLNAFANTDIDLVNIVSGTNVTINKSSKLNENAKIIVIAKSADNGTHSLTSSEGYIYNDNLHKNYRYVMSDDVNHIFIRI